MSKVRWAVVGTSDFALDWIARGISLGSNAELVAVVSRDEARGAAAAKRVGAAHHFTSIQAIDTSLVDGVFLVLPNTQHAPQAIVAAKRGLHVIAEKPMAPTLQECAEMIQTAKDNNVVLAVAHCMNWAPPVVKARELVASGAIGDVISISISGSFNYPPADRWRQDDSTEQGGGPLHDMGVHSIDTIVSILGQPITTVSALFDHKIYNYPAEDSTTVLVRFANGVHGIVQSHYNTNQNSLEIQGTKGRIWSSPWLGREFAGDLHLEQNGQVTDFNLDSVNVYVPQIEDVSNAVLNKQETSISGERGMQNMKVIWAAIESARSGRTVSL